MHHPVHVQVFHTDDAVGIDNATTLLMGEVVTPEGNTLMYPRDALAMLATFGSAFGELGMLALDIGKGLFFLAKEAWVLDFLPIREGGKRLESDINTDLGRKLRKSFWFTLHREGSVPFTRAALANSKGFDSAFDRSMIDHLDAANLRETHPIIMRGRPGDGDEVETRLGKGKAIVAAIAFETGIAWGFTCLDTTKEGFQCKVYSFIDILQDLRVNQFQRRTLRFEQRNTCLSVIARNRTLLLFPGILTVCQCLVIEPTALLKNNLEHVLLLLVRIQPIPIRLSHAVEHSTFLSRVQVLFKNKLTLRYKGCGKEEKVIG